MEPGDGRATEATLLSRRRYLLAAGALSAGAGLGAASEDATAATAITADVTTAAIDHEWQRIGLSTDYAAPVAFALPLSYEGQHPATTRLRNVGGSAIEATIEEWRYLDEWHTTETVGCLVTESGTYTLGDGSPVAIGTVRTDHEWASASFPSSFSTAPIVLTQTQTFRGHHTHVTRNRNVSASGFDVRIQEEESTGGNHVTERIGYLAVEPGSETLDGRPYEAGHLSVDDGWATIAFDRQFQDPVFLADVQTFHGPNPCGLRYRNLTGASVDVMVEEEESSDDEVWHTNERVGYLVVEGADVTAGSTGYGAGRYGRGGYAE